MAANEEAVHGYGTGLFVCQLVNPAPDVITDLVAVNEVPKMVDVTWPFGKFTRTNTTHLKSYRKYKEAKPGFGEPGQMTFRCRYSEYALAVLSDFLPQAGDDNILTWYSTEPDGSHGICNGWLTSIVKTTGEDDAVLLEGTVEITGPVNFQEVTT